MRHTKPDVSDGTCYGCLDLPLADTFELEAAAVLRHLVRPEVLVSSPMQRCVRLAEKISAAFKLPLVIDDRAREMDFGAWEGMLWDEISRTQADQWDENFFTARPHGGESVEMLTSRVQSALADYRKSSKAHIIVCHAGVIKAAKSTGTLASDFSTSVSFGGIVQMCLNAQNSYD